jgi:four helix bundle protein
MARHDSSGFEHLDVWQLARQLSAGIVPVAAAANARRDFDLSQQLNAAGLSIMSNIAEGYLRRSSKEFAYFVRIAAGSNGEVRAILYAAFDRGYLESGHLKTLTELSNRIGQLLSGLHRRLVGTP